MLNASVFNVASCCPPGALMIALHAASSAASAYLDNPEHSNRGGAAMRGRAGGAGHSQAGASTGSTVAKFHTESQAYPLPGDGAMT
jgi:hypothetical protein